MGAERVNDIEESCQLMKQLVQQARQEQAKELAGVRTLVYETHLKLADLVESKVGLDEVTKVLQEFQEQLIADVDSKIDQNS